eukprot:2732114-Lingulodinium_polyedra.AAC.1
MTTRYARGARGASTRLGATGRPMVGRRPTTPPGSWAARGRPRWSGATLLPPPGTKPGGAPCRPRQGRTAGTW